MARKYPKTGDIWWSTRPRRRVRVTEVDTEEGRLAYVVVSHPNPDRIGGDGSLSFATLHREYHFRSSGRNACWSCGVRMRPEGGGSFMRTPDHDPHCPRFQDRHKYRGPVRLARALEVGSVAVDGVTRRIMWPKGMEVGVVAFSKWAPEKFVVECPVDASVDALRSVVHGVPVDALKGWPE